MNEPQTNRKAHVPDSTVKHMTVKGSKDWAAFGRFVAELEEFLGWYSNAVYQGHNITRKGDRWLLVVRADKKTGPVVAFYEATTTVACFRILYDHAVSDKINWRKDTYRS